MSPPPQSRRQKKREAKEKRLALDAEARKKQRSLRVDFATHIPDGYELYFEVKQ